MSLNPPNAHAKSCRTYFCFFCFILITKHSAVILHKTYFFFSCFLGTYLLGNRMYVVIFGYLVHYILV